MLFGNYVRSFEAPAEIFDFVAGLVQRVPKKEHSIKADLKNSTDRLREYNVVLILMEAGCFRYKVTLPTAVTLSGDVETVEVEWV